MGERSLYISVMLSVTAFVGCVGLFFVVDSFSMLKQQQAKSEKTLARLARTVETLTKKIEGGVSVKSNGSDDNASANDSDNEEFANSYLEHPEAVDGGRMITSTTSFSGNLNYLISNEGLTGSVWDMCNDSLAERDFVNVKKYKPRLAKSWSISKDGLVYDIKLRENAMWHPFVDPVTSKKVESKNVTAEDFVFYWDTVQNPKIPCDPTRGYMKLMDKIESTGKYSLRVTWKEPYSLAESITLGLSPLPKHFYRPDDSCSDKKFVSEFITSQRNQTVVGCGAYRLKNWDKGKGMFFERFEGYYGPKPHIKTRAIKKVADFGVALIEFKKGNLDRQGVLAEQWVKETDGKDFHLVTKSPKTAFADSLKHDELKRAGKEPKDYKYEKYSYQRFAYAWIGWNSRVRFFKDKRVRAALTHVVNRQRIIDDVKYGNAVITTGPFVPQSPYYDKNIKPIPFDLKEATRRLAAVGWKDTDGDGYIDKRINGKRVKFAFTMAIPGGAPSWRKIATIVQGDMQRVGIDMQIKVYEWSLYVKALDEWSFDACALLWGGGIEGDPYQVWHSSQGKNKKLRGSNYIGYDSAEADKLIEKGRRTVDLEKRIKIYNRFHKLLNDEQPYTFLFCPTSLVLMQKRFRNARVFNHSDGMSTRLMWVPLAEQVDF